MRSSPPQMVGSPHPPGSPCTIPYSDVLSFRDQAYNSPPYSEHPSYGLQPSSEIAELPSPGEKKSQMYISTDTTQRNVPSPAPTPQPQSRPFSLWGRSTKPQYVEDSEPIPFSTFPLTSRLRTSELLTESEPKGPIVTTSRYQSQP